MGSNAFACLPHTRGMAQNPPKGGDRWFPAHEGENRTSRLPLERRSHRKAYPSTPDPDLGKTFNTQTLHKHNKHIDGGIWGEVRPAPLISFVWGPGKHYLGKIRENGKCRVFVFNNLQARKSCQTG